MNNEKRIFDNYNVVFWELFRIPKTIGGQVNEKC